MKYLKYLLIYLPVFIVFINKVSFSQKHNKNLMFKLYGNFEYEYAAQSYLNTPTQRYYEGSYEDYGFSKITPAICFGKDYIHEIELSNLNFSKNTDYFDDDSKSKDYKTTGFNIAVRYEYDFMSIKNSSHKFQPYLCLSLKQSFSNSKKKYFSSNYFSKELEFRIYYSIVPGFNINISKIIVLNVNVPINLGMFEFESYNASNCEKVSQLKHYFYPSKRTEHYDIYGKDSENYNRTRISFLVRMGLALRLNKINLNRKQRERKEKVIHRMKSIRNF